MRHKIGEPDKLKSPKKRSDSFASSLNGEQMSVPSGIADMFRKKILKGELTSGNRIIESRWCKELRVGQPSVREALLLLESQGLVQRIPNLGTFVTELSIKDVSNLYQIRGELEGLAAELAARKAQKEDIAELRQLIENMKSDLSKHGTWGYFKNDLKFHERIWVLSGNQHLAALLEKIVVPLLAFSFMRVERDPDELIQSIDLHTPIVDAIAAADPKNARQVLQHTVRLFLDRDLSVIFQQ
jgi:DNA-binding GntR family transcriptional regulator